MNWIKEMWHRATGRVKATPLVGADVFAQRPVHMLKDYADYLAAGSKKVWATWRAIDTIANAVKTTPFQLVKAGNFRIAVDGLDRLLSYPNHNETWRDFLYRTIFHYRLTGTAYWLKSEADGNGNRPRNLYTLNPGRVQIVPDSTTGIKGYLFQVDGRKIPFDREEIMLFRRPHPNNDVLGLGDIEAGESLFNEYINRLAAQQRFYENGAQPSGLLINRAPQVVSEEEWETAKKKWQEQYGGKGNAGKTAWLSGNWSYQQLSMTPKDMQDIERSRFTVEQIFLLHGVPLSVAGIRTAASYDTAEIDNQRFRQYTVLPDVLTLQDTINTDLVEGFDPAAKFHFDVSRLINVERIMADFGPVFDRGGLTVNQLRSLCGLPINDADERRNQCFISAALSPMDASPAAIN